MKLKAEQQMHKTAVEAKERSQNSYRKKIKKKHTHNFQTIPPNRLSWDFSSCMEQLPLFCCVVFTDITITKWHVPFFHQQLMCAIEETFCKRGVWSLPTSILFQIELQCSSWMNCLSNAAGHGYTHSIPEWIWFDPEEQYKGTAHWLIKRTEGRWG